MRRIVPDRAGSCLIAVMIGALVTLLTHPGGKMGWGGTPMVYIVLLTIVGVMRWRERAGGGSPVVAGKAARRGEAPRRQGRQPLLRVEYPVDLTERRRACECRERAVIRNFPGREQESRPRGARQRPTYAYPPRAARGNLLHRGKVRAQEHVHRLGHFLHTGLSR